MSLLGLIILKLKTAETGYFTERWSVGAWFRYMGNKPQVISSWKGREATCEVTFGGTEVFNIEKSIGFCRNIIQRGFPSDKPLPRGCQGICVVSVFTRGCCLFLPNQSREASSTSSFHPSSTSSILQNCKQVSRDPCSNM